MVNLMTMAVEGLDEGHVSITDSSGKVLFAPEDETTGLNNAHLNTASSWKAAWNTASTNFLPPCSASAR